MKTVTDNSVDKYHSINKIVDQIRCFIIFVFFHEELEERQDIESKKRLSEALRHLDESLRALNMLYENKDGVPR